jgi:hypothetical protein
MTKEKAKPKKMAVSMIEGEPDIPVKSDEKGEFLEHKGQKKYLN